MHSYKRNNEFERSINTLEQYYILRTSLYLPLFNSLPTIPKPTREILAGKKRITQITRNNQSLESKRSVQRLTNVTSLFQAQDTNDKVNKTQTIVTSIETKEDNLRKKLDAGLQNIKNKLSALYE